MTAPQLTAGASAQLSQTGLATVISPLVEQALSQVDVRNLAQSIPNLKLLIAALTKRYGAASGTLAARQYMAQRKASGVITPFTPRVAQPAPMRQVGATVDWAVAPLFGAEPDIQTVQQQLTVATERMVLDQGRQTIVDNTLHDRQAKGWARVPEPGACYFCAMLATRGAVYKHETADFRTHDNCRCHAEPVFNAYEPSAQVREWQALYANATRGVHGMKNAQRAFRAAFIQQ